MVDTGYLVDDYYRYMITAVSNCPG